MSSVWQIYYDFLSATTKLLSPKSLASFRQMRVAFISPKSVAVPVRAQVARFIVNNNRKQWIAARSRLLQPQVGPSLDPVIVPAEAKRRAETHDHRPVIMGLHFRADDPKGMHWFVSPKCAAPLALMLRRIAAQRKRR